MREWLDFFLYAIGKVVDTLFSFDTGLGFSFGQLELALIVIGLVATALIVKIANPAVKDMSE